MSKPTFSLTLLRGAPLTPSIRLELEKLGEVVVLDESSDMRIPDPPFVTYKNRFYVHEKKRFGSGMLKGLVEIDNVSLISYPKYGIRIRFLGDLIHFAKAGETPSKLVYALMTSKNFWLAYNKRSQKTLPERIQSLLDRPTPFRTFDVFVKRPQTLTLSEVEKLMGWDGKEPVNVETYPHDYPPDWVQDIGKFSASSFIEAIERGYTRFAIFFKAYLVVKDEKAYLFHTWGEIGNFAVMNIFDFNEAFDHKESEFGFRIENILKSNTAKFLVGPLKMSKTEALELMGWNPHPESSLSKTGD